MWNQVVASPLLELLEKIRAPIGAVNFQAVAENRVRTIGGKCLHQPIADMLQIMFNGGSVVVIDDEAFGPNCRSLHLHACATRNKEKNLSRTTRLREHHDVIVNFRESLILVL